MKKAGKQQRSSILHLFIYGLSFLLLWEWLRPIPTVTNTGHIHVFLWFALFSSILIYFRISLFLSIPALLAGSIYSLHSIFGENPFFSREGGLETLQQFLAEAASNIQLIFSWELAGLTDFFRTFLLFLLLALICYLLYFWIFHTKKIFFFLLATIIYITVLDTFTAVDASMAIIRIFVISFFIMTLLHMLKIQTEERAIRKKDKLIFSTAWMYTLIVMVLIATSVGYAAPKFEPQWGDPVPTIKRLVTGQEGGWGSGSGSRRIGYGDNDERLGGGFIQDDGIVFTAETEEPVYWRGESKNVYTGHGWTSEPMEAESESIFENAVDYYMFHRNVQMEEQRVRILMEHVPGYSHLFYPGQLIDVERSTLEYEIDGRKADDPLAFMTDILSGKVRAEGPNPNARIRLAEYTLTVQTPKYSLEKLKNVSPEDPENIRNYFLQLPDTLPERVIELAEEITADYDNRYDKVVAVEQYFSRNGFEYRTEDVPIPEGGEDYVDQFLFESQYGYCDNYSTAMAVLLRAVDIPTRWVKGFTEGEYVGNTDDGNRRYEIANSNAHSWVEVYFPEVGWVPFEPTQGFNNRLDFEEAEREQNHAVNTPVESNEPEQERPELDDLMSPLENDAFSDYEGPSGGAAFGTGTDTSGWLTAKTVIISIVVLLMAVIVYRRQSRIQNRYFLLQYRLIGSDERFGTAYRRLLRLLANEGMPLEDGETLREYATRVDRMLNSDAMTSLTKTYEKIYYGGRQAEGDWQKQKEQWERLVNALSS
ncbi:protein of unknown function [Evansella caseinilytica]|uniref:Transglutaminase-like domain-containing protein n=1 Tax=Evansella caseinilytica TaxID=1503961 RepID=A0A1H3TP79_9BACI|nr:DUF4129 domain-containing transglutaminase family protein [Evansella caseinilytica]SDZ51708.1 protein of unknown function [Evansella caseinilytica]